MEKIFSVLNYACTRLVSENTSVFGQLENSKLINFIVPSCKNLLNECSKVVYELRYFEKEKQTIKTYKNTIIYSNKLNQDALWDLAHLLGQTIEAQIEKKGLFSVHSSAFCREDGKGVLVIGAPLAGKTTIAVAAAEHRFNFVSNDRSIVNPKTKQIVGGTDIVAIKKIAAEQYLSFSEKYNEALQKDTYIFEARQFLKTASTCSLDLILLPKLNDGRNKQFELRKNLLKLLLCESAADLITGEYLLFNMTRPAPNLDTLDTRIKRIEGVLELSNTPAYFIEGDTTYILNNIDNLLSKQK